jgi:hypothetical protein
MKLPVSLTLSLGSFVCRDSGEGEPSRPEGMGREGSRGGAREVLVYTKKEGRKEDKKRRKEEEEKKKNRRAVAATNCVCKVHTWEDP